MKADDRLGDDTGHFGEAAEDGLRMIAALETMPSLEPDCTDIFVAEAAVMIVERMAQVVEEEEPRDMAHARAGSLRARLRNADEAPEISADEYAAYRSHVEEATVEIVDPAGDEEANLEPVREKRKPTVRRFFKALTGGD